MQARTIEDALRVLMRATRSTRLHGMPVWSMQRRRAAPGEVRYEERWASERAIENHVESEAFTKVLEVMEAAEGPPHVGSDFVSRHQGLECRVEDVRRGGDSS